MNWFIKLNYVSNHCSDPSFPFPYAPCPLPNISFPFSSLCCPYSIKMCLLLVLILKLKHYIRQFNFPIFPIFQWPHALSLYPYAPIPMPKSLCLLLIYDIIALHVKLKEYTCHEYKWLFDSFNLTYVNGVKFCIFVLFHDCKKKISDHLWNLKTENNSFRIHDIENNA